MIQGAPEVRGQREARRRKQGRKQGSPQASRGLPLAPGAALALGREITMGLGARGLCWEESGKCLGASRGRGEVTGTDWTVRISSNESRGDRRRQGGAAAGAGRQSREERLLWRIHTECLGGFKGALLRVARLCGQPGVPARAAGAPVPASWSTRPPSTSVSAGPHLGPPAPEFAPALPCLAPLAFAPPLPCLGPYPASAPPLWVPYHLYLLFLSHFHTPGSLGISPVLLVAGLPCSLGCAAAGLAEEILASSEQTLDLREVPDLGAW